VNVPSDFLNTAKSSDSNLSYTSRVTGALDVPFTSAKLSMAVSKGSRVGSSSGEGDCAIEEAENDEGEEEELSEVIG